MSTEIKNIIQRYWSGETTQQEEIRLQAYMVSGKVADEHLDMVELFSFFDEQHGQTFPGELNMDKVYSSSLSPGDALVEKYLDGESSLEEEVQLKNYLFSDQVTDKDLDIREMFTFFEGQKTSSLPVELDMDKIYGASLTPMEALVEKYLDAETSLKEEVQLKTYLASDRVAEEHKDLIPMFQSFESETVKTFTGDLSELERLQTQWSQKPKVRYMFPKVIGVAASLALLMMVAFNFLQEDTASYKGKYTELQDPEEALELTKDALAFLGMKYDKGTASMKYIKELEKTNVFNFKNNRK